MHHLDLFSGIGGFALAADWVWPGCRHTFCEIDSFCQAVLEKHWPDAPIYGDIRHLTMERYSRDFGNPGGIDLLTGGFPCQPFSCAGLQLGMGDHRYLWPEMLRVIHEFEPRWVVGENVAGIINLALDQVLVDLEAAGYEVWPLVIPACAVDALHIRDRVWILAHTVRSQPCRQHAGAPHALRAPRHPPIGLQSEPRRVAHGVPDWAHRLRALGNAIVPQVAANILPASGTLRKVPQI